MNFEQWKLRRELEEETEFNSFNSKVKSVTTLCFILFGVGVLALIVVVTALYNF
jgi:hypothetical protein